MFGKKFLLILIILSVSSKLFALDLFPSKDWIPNVTRFGIGNDTLTLGDGENHDDQLSFSLEGRVGAPLWFLNFEMLSITNKDWTWVDGGDDFQGRYDVLALTFGLNLRFIDNDSLRVNLVPEVGFSFQGNGGFQDLQNKWHSLLGLHKYYFDYEQNIYSPELSLTADAVYFWKLGETKLGLGASLNFVNKINFQYEQNLMARFEVENNNKNIISLSFIWRFLESTGKNKTQDVFLWYLRGPALEARLNAGIFSVVHERSFKNSFSYTTLYVNFFEIFDAHPTWKKTDFFFEYGLYTYSSKNVFSIKFGYKFPNLPLRIYFEDHYASGVSFVSRVERDNAFWTLGLQYDIPDEWSKKIFSPFVAAGFGLARHKWFYNDGFNDGDNITRDSVYGFIADMSVGFSLIPPGLIVTTNTSYRINVTFGGRFNIDNGRINDFFLERWRMHRSDTEGYNSVNIFEWRVTVGLELSLDL